MREAIAALLIKNNVPFDCRSAAKNGGGRDDNKKWMKASVVNVLLAVMPTLIWDLCDVRYLDNKGVPEPLQSFEDMPASSTPAADAATSDGSEAAAAVRSAEERTQRAAAATAKPSSAPKVSRPTRAPVAARAAPVAAQPAQPAAGTSHPCFASLFSSYLFVIFRLIV